MFTNTWHANQSRFWDIHVKPTNLKSYLEIGSHEGQSAKWVLDTFPESHVTCIDTWDGGGQGEANENYVDIEARFKANMAPYGERVKAIKSYSFNALKALDETFDVIYVDGSHLSKHVLEDAVLSFRLLNPGGLLIFDDFGWKGYAEPHKNPKLAIDVFVSCNRDQLTVLHVGWQVIVRKHVE